MRICSVCTDRQDDGEFKPQCNICKSCLVIHHKYRINNDLNSYLSLLFNTADSGYVLTNVALIAAEFQGPSQWSVEKYREFMNLLEVEHKAQEIDFVACKTGKKKKTFVKRTIINGMNHFICTHCSIAKPSDEFGKDPCRGCKSCRYKLYEAYNATPRGKFVSLLSGMNSSSKRRGHGNISISMVDLIDLWKSQGGLCAYSGIPMKFSSWWKCSIERIDINRGYLFDNICFICHEFNTPDQTNRSRNLEEVTGNTAWNLSKIEFIKSIIAGCDTVPWHCLKLKQWL